MGVAVAALNTVYAVPAAKAEGDVRRLLRTARWTYRQRTGGPTSLAVDAGMVFDYFNGVSKIIETARKDILFIDPYLDASFVERYLSFIDGAVPVRLLGREKQATLIPAAQAFAKQYGRSVEVRSASNFHDRFVFIDQFQCFQSGASFKDGANRTPTTLTEITDAFAEVQKTYEALWGAAKVDFKS
ncbi:hypothetical protein CK231_00095 [Mesorhizobium loti]|uniref:Phospholipase D-like domain-containing protein n=2 Tax=Mesorhizobium TaxID=68287 RepID=A0A1A5JQ94_RHILI|nr:hypothetical protein BAE42_03245 [Mesorhizobium loti]OBP83701.1 hypothetical protein BAE39_09700 [Mesorhizobium loti]OBP91990.1 hypothetical protein BAE41_02765 [Mesorhizobium loti]OBP93534.1 hypothetical protein BAE38_09705 [Mesorhizobium loti]OBP95507.1 hypothetical protein BAE40_09480 [Mesorhizobium loti]